MLCLTSELAEVQLRIYVIFLLCVDLIHEAFVQFLADGLFLQMLTDEYDLDHSVAHLVVPFLSELFLTCQNSSSWSLGMVAIHCPACFTVFCLPACSNT